MNAIGKHFYEVTLDGANIRISIQQVRVLSTARLRSKNEHSAVIALE